MKSGRPNMAAVALGLGGLLLATAALVLYRTGGTQRQQSEQVAAAGSAAVSRGIEELWRALAADTSKAQHVRALRAALEREVDAETLRDMLATEDSLAPFRGRLALVLRAGKAWVGVGQGAEALAGATLLAGADNQPARGWVARKAGDATAVAVLPLPVNRPVNYTLVLGQPLEGGVLDRLAASSGAALLVTDGKAAGGFAGPPERRAALAAVVGQEYAGVRTDRQLGAVLVPVGVAPGVWVWAAHVLPGGAPVSPLLPLLLAPLALLALAAAGLLWRRRPAPAAAAPRREAPASASWPLPQGASSLSLSSSSSSASASSRASSAPSSATHPTRIAAGHSQTFGRYTLLDRVGEGGMSELFTAVLAGAEGFTRLYVIKRLKPDFAQHKGAVDQFIDEAKLGSQLLHGNIVPVLDFGRIGTGYFLAQEYVRGRNLAELCERHGERIGEPLPMSLVCYIAHEALGALAYAHERTDDNGHPLSIVHRDVSSGNIMVTEQGEVKLLDFGIVRATDRVSRTDLGQVKGNAVFMAPEQARGQPVDNRADLFSLGMVMYFALSGRLLYDSHNSAEAFYQATTGLTADHLARIRALPPQMAEILERALAMDANNRYPNAREFAEVLAPFISGSKGQLATLMKALFGEDLRRQTASFRAKLPEAQPG